MSADPEPPFAVADGENVARTHREGDALGPCLRTVRAMPGPIVARAKDGAVLAWSSAAAREFRLSPEQWESATLTRISRARPLDPGRELFLLSIDCRPERRVHARAGELAVAPGVAIDLVAIEPPPDVAAPVPAPDGGTAASLERELKAAALAAERLLRAQRDGKVTRAGVERLANRLGRAAAAARLRGGGRPAGGRVWIGSRDLLARLLQRLRRQNANAERPRVAVVDESRQSGRLLHLDPIGAAELFLNAVGLVLDDTAARALVLRCSSVGCRLQISVEVSPAASPLSEPLTLEDRSARLRDLAPLVRRHGATLELHTDAASGSKVVITLPTWPERDSEPL